MDEYLHGMSKKLHTERISGPRGRPRRHWVDVLRSQIWYRAVKISTGLSDYELDKRFAGYPGEDGVARPATDVFARIRRLGLLPSRGAHPKSAHDLVAAVEKEFPGSQAYYEAEFWELLKNPPSLTDTNQLLETCLAELDLKRVLWAEAQVILQGHGNRLVDERSGYNLCLKAALTLLDSLDQLRLLALLSREADLANNSLATELARNFFDETLEVFLCQLLGTEDGLDAYHRAVEEYLFGNRSLMSTEVELRERLQFESSCVVVHVSFSDNT